MSNQLHPLLKQVSRSFYLTLRMLPGSVREQIGLAYLLARATDTIADTALVSIERRQAALHQLREAISTAAEGSTAFLPDFGDLAEAQQAPAGQGSLAERNLLESLDQALEILRCFPPEDRQRIGEVLNIIASGQSLDLMRFGSANPEKIEALSTDAELDDYTYRVAGCVGEFWTKMCLAHLFPKAALDDTFLMVNGVRFGKGLQLVNILRDVSRDLRQGRCYLPYAALTKQHLTPKDLLSPEAMERLRPLYNDYIRQAEEHLAAGWAYILILPRKQIRIRLACAWPILIGARTLARLRGGNVLDDRHRIKISRADIRHILIQTLLYYPRPATWNLLYSDARNMSGPARGKKEG